MGRPTITRIPTALPTATMTTIIRMDRATSLRVMACPTATTTTIRMARPTSNQQVMDHPTVTTTTTTTMTITTIHTVQAISLPATDPPTEITMMMTPMDPLTRGTDRPTATITMIMTTPTPTAQAIHLRAMDRPTATTMTTITRTDLVANLRAMVQEAMTIRTARPGTVRTTQARTTRTGRRTEGMATIHMGLAISLRATELRHSMRTVRTEVLAGKMRTAMVARGVTTITKRSLSA